MAAPLLSIPFLRAGGSETSLAEFAGRVVLVVNVASKCGFTPQYQGLQNLYARYRDRGLMVVGFPANDFLRQEPGTDAEIQQFCRVNYGVEFPVFAKIIVKGDGQHPLYAALTSALPEAETSDGLLDKVKNLARFGSKGHGDISWNFEKFLIDRVGKAVRRFAPGIKPEDERLIAALEAELKRA